MSWLYGRPTAAELVAAVADFLDNDVRSSTGSGRQVNFHARVAANVLRIVERELTDDSAAEVTGRLAELGFADEAQLAAAIRAGTLDDRADDVLPTLRALVRHRLAVAHPVRPNLQDRLTTPAAPAGTRRDRWPKVFRANAPHRSGSPPAPRPSPGAPLW